MRGARMGLLVAGLLAGALLASACSGAPKGTDEGPLGGGPIASGAWVGPLVKVNGTIYFLSREPAIAADQLGQVVGQVSRKLATEATVEDGDSNFLAAGAKLYAIKGYDPAVALAAEWQGEFVVLRPNLGPNEIRRLGQ